MRAWRAANACGANSPRQSKTAKAARRIAQVCDDDTNAVNETGLLGEGFCFPGGNVLGVWVVLVKKPYL